MKIRSIFQQLTCGFRRYSITQGYCQWSANRSVTFLQKFPMRWALASAPTVILLVATLFLFLFFDEHSQTLHFSTRLSHQSLCSTCYVFLSHPQPGGVGGWGWGTKNMKSTCLHIWKLTSSTLYLIWTATDVYKRLPGFTRVMFQLLHYSYFSLKKFIVSRI